MQELQRTNSIFEAAFNKSVGDVEKQLGPAMTHLLPPNCLNVKTDLIQCYKDKLNLHETLKCSQHVTNFNACVNLNS